MPINDYRLFIPGYLFIPDYNPGYVDFNLLRRNSAAVSNYQRNHYINFPITKTTGLLVTNKEKFRNGEQQAFRHPNIVWDLTITLPLKIII